MTVKNLSKPFTCLVCQKRKPWRDLVKHVAYAGDSEHKQWRISHGFPANIAFGIFQFYLGNGSFYDKAFSNTPVKKSLEYAVIVIYRAIGGFPSAGLRAVTRESPPVASFSSIG